MRYFGPHFEQSPTDHSIWTWLFEDTSTKSKIGSPSSNHGFRDASTGAFISFGGLKTAAEQASTTLALDFGIKPHETVSIVAKNSVEYPLAMMSASRLGAVVTTLPVGASAEELAYFFQTSGTTIVFTDDDELPRVRSACRATGLAEDRISLLHGKTPGIMKLWQLVDRGKQFGPSKLVRPWRPAQDEGASTCAFLSFSSGTTGKPKAVRISHVNIISQLRQVRQMTLGNRGGVVLGILPFYHITGLVHLLHLPILLRQDLVLLPKFNMTDMMEAITRYLCDELWLVPPLLIRLLQDPVAKRCDLSFVKQFNTGAAPLATEIVAQLAKTFPHIAVRQAWGMTETTSCVTITPPLLTTWDNAFKVGKLVPGTEIRIVDPGTGHDIGPGESGEIWVKGPQVTLGYLDRPQDTAESYLDDGFLRTGDLGSIDQDGFVTIHDRLKEMIKVRGHGVAPAELEDILLGHPAVSDAAVIGIPDQYSGEVPRAFVVVKSLSLANYQTAQELQDVVRQKRAKHKWLAGGVEFIDVLPKSPSGKILRRKLKTMWLESQKRQLAAKL